MSTVGQIERITQNRVVNLFRQLGYTYLGNWETREKNRNIEQNQTVWLIDWKHPENNDFAIAEEVTIKGENKKRPDIVLYVNGIALGILELKRSSVALGEGIRQNLDNQKKTFIRPFFTTMQLVMAGNDTQGLRYGTIETPGEPLGNENWVY